MANFLTRLVTRHLGLTPVVQPLITPMFASEAVVLESWGAGEMESGGAGELEGGGDGETGRWGDGERGRWGAEETGSGGDGESSNGTGKMPILQAELSSVGGVGVSPVQAMGTSSEVHLSRQTEPSSSSTPKADTPQNQGSNFITTPPTQPSPAPGVMQRQVDANMRSHSSIDSPINSPNLPESAGFVVEDISLEQPTLPLVPPPAIPFVQPTTTNAPSRIEPLVNEVLETGQQRDHTQYSLDQTSLTSPYEGRRESSSPLLQGEGQGEPLTEPYGNNTEVSERDRSNVQLNSQTSNLVQDNIPKELKPTPAVQPSPASGMIQPLRSAESPISPPIQARQSQASHHPNSVPDIPNTSPSSQPSATPQEQNQGNAANVNLPELPLVRSETVLPIPPSVASKPSRVEPLIDNDIGSSFQPTQQLIESDLNSHHINIEKSINRQQNTPTSWSSEQMRGRIEGEMGQSLPDDSSSKPAPTVPSRTLSQQPETSTGSNPPLRTPAPQREFIQLVPQRSMSASQSVPVSGVPDGETGRRGDGGKESVGSLTATGDERMSEQSFVPQQNVDDPPKSPLTRGTLSNMVSSVNRETVSNIVPPQKRETVSNTVSPINRETGSSIVPPVNRETVSNTIPPVNRETVSNTISPVNRETVSNIIPPFLRGARGDRAMFSTIVPPVNRETVNNTIPPVNRETVNNTISPVNRETVSNIVPPFLRGARGDRVMPSTVETLSESSSAMQVQIQNEKLSSLTRRSLSVLSLSSSRQSSVSPLTNDVPEFPSSEPIHRRNPANFAPTTRLNPVETTPTIQISIGRIEVRASQPQTPPPRTKSTQRGPTQSLQDYLKQRQGGNS